MKAIKDIPECDRPREKLATKGVAFLSDEELVQVILGRRVEGYDVRSISKEFATIIQEKKAGLAGSDLTAIRGIGRQRLTSYSQPLNSPAVIHQDTVRITKAETPCPYSLTLSANNRSISFAYL